MRGTKIMFALMLILVVAANAYANGEVHDEQEEAEISSLNLVFVAFAGVLVLAGIGYLGQKHIGDKGKTLLFVLIVILTLGTTTYVAGGTILLNLESEAGGPVHWHADFEIWACGEPLELKTPEGLTNRVGSSTFHEHGDNRIHVEGTPLKLAEVDLHSFFGVVGGLLTQEKIIIPTDTGLREFSNGDLCNGSQAKLQVFVYKVDGNSQQKLQNFEDYILSPHSNVPPGDCIIIEFDEEKERTDKLCVSYKR